MWNINIKLQKPENKKFKTYLWFKLFLVTGNNKLLTFLHLIRMVQNHLQKIIKMLLYFTFSGSFSLSLNKPLFHFCPKHNENYLFNELL